MNTQRSPTGEPLDERDLERIAAFVDGTLDDRERGEVIELLGRSEEASQVYAGVLSTSDTSTPAGGDAPAAPERGGPAGEGRGASRAAGRPLVARRWLPVASGVAAIVAVGLAAARMAGITGAREPTYRLLSSLDVPSAGAAQAAARDPVTPARGDGVPFAGDGGYAFRIGVRVVDVLVYDRAGLRLEADRARLQLEALLERLAVPPAVGIGVPRDGTGSATGEDRRGVDALQRWLRERDPALERGFAFGLGSEAARLAAWADQTSYLASRRGRAYLALAPELPLSDQAVGDLEVIEDLLRGDLTPATSHRIAALLERPMREAGS